GTGECTAGHRWVICWAQVGGASGRTAGHRWAELAGGTAGHRSLSDREESTAENRQLSERGSAPIIRALMIGALMIGAQQCHPQVLPTCAQQCAH
ncbi:unnamed protein product, partial [Staurois parvus]